MQQAATLISWEGLTLQGTNGRLEPRLAEGWSRSSDGLVWRIRLREGGTFHDKTPATAAVIAEILTRRLPAHLGRVFDDIREIRPVSEYEIEITLKRPSNFVLEGLDVQIYTGMPPDAVGTGPFYIESASEEGVVMTAYPGYYLGTPTLDEIAFRPYTSVRSAWVDLLRAEVDMLYEVGVDAIGFLQPSSEVRTYSFPRPYLTALIFNVRRGELQDPGFRRAVNAAVDRQAIVDNALSGIGTPATSPVWPLHWAYDAASPHFRFDPKVLEGKPSGRPRLTVLYTDPSHERLALLLQRQLREIGVEIGFERATVDKALERVNSGDFDAWLADAISGPTMIRPYWFWYSRERFNWGGFSSPIVDRALDDIRSAPDENSYRRSVAALQRAMVEDPPALFLAWSERARAVNSRFEIPTETGRDIFPMTLRLWRPSGERETAHSN